MAAKKADKKSTEEKKPEKIQSPRGVHDILPENHAYFTAIKKVVRHRARQAGFRRISTPMFEERSLFERSVGDSSDIVEKELYSFQTKKGGVTYALKPESTAGVVRAYLQHGMASLPQPVELYYFEPHFRHDRPQKGRFRQFHQFGMEVLGENDPGVDAQIIQTAKTIFDDLGIGDELNLQINSIGCPECRGNYIQILRDFFVGKERNLCEDCRRRLEENPLRILDCKEEDCKILADMAPKFEICGECKDHHKKLGELLDVCGVEFEENPKLVRGLDYYTRTVFEFVDENGLAAGGGGRYDGLVELLGGKPTPGVGFAAGVERVMEMMKEARILAPDKDKIQVYVAQLGYPAKKVAMQLLAQLRERGVHALGAVGSTSIKNQLSKADKFGCKFAVILGEVEVREGAAIIRDMSAGTQKNHALAKVPDAVVKLLGGEKNLDLYDPSEELKKDTTVRPEEELLIRD